MEHQNSWSDKDKFLHASRGSGRREWGWAESGERRGGGGPVWTASDTTISNLRPHQTLPPRPLTLPPAAGGRRPPPLERQRMPTPPLIIPRRQLAVSILTSGMDSYLQSDVCVVELSFDGWLFERAWGRGEGVRERRGSRSSEKRGVTHWKCPGGNVFKCLSEWIKVMDGVQGAPRVCWWKE